MKRIFQRKARLACPESDAATVLNNDVRTSVESSSSSRKSATMIGLALSVAASGLVVHQQDDRASAAEPQVSMSSPASAGLSSVHAARSSGATSEQESITHHVVREGDTLWSIADHYQVSKDEIIASNTLESENVLQVGQTISIPVEVQPLPQVPNPVAIDEASAQQATRNLAHIQIQKASEVLHVRDSSSAATDESTLRAPRAGSLNQQPAVHSSQSFDGARSRAEGSINLSAVRSEAENSVAVSTSRADASGLDESASPSLRVVQPPANALDADTDSVAYGSRATRHRAQPGETLESIALSHRVDLQSIIELNQLSDPDELQVGQTLLLPEGGDRHRVHADQPTLTSGRAANSNQASPVKGENNAASLEVSALQQRVDAEVPISQDAAHQIRPGETLAEIARNYSVSLSDLIDHNSIHNPDRVFAGQMIHIPASGDPESVVVPTSPTQSNESRTGYSTLPGALFGVTDLPDLQAAPVVPLPIASSSESSDLSSPEVQGNSPAGIQRSKLSDTDGASSSVSSTAVNRQLRADGGEASSNAEMNVYVEGLLGEIREIERSVASFEDNSSLAAHAVPDQTYLNNGDAVNPEFARSSGLQTRLDSDSQSAAASTVPSQPQSSSEPNLVAVAPVGSENYIPLGQPATGRTVSPDLPPLPGADQYIPEGSATFNGYLWPARGVFTSGYGWRWGRMHRGIDIAAPVGTPIYAAAPGVIEFSGWNSGGYGNMVDIRHPDGSKTRYAHNSRNLVQAGQTVTQGQQIAEMGSTGYSTGPHVHFEIHIPNRGAVNPVAFLPDR